MQTPFAPPIVPPLSARSQQGMRKGGAQGRGLGWCTNGRAGKGGGTRERAEGAHQREGRTLGSVAQQCGGLHANTLYAWCSLHAAKRAHGKGGCKGEGWRGAPMGGKGGYGKGHEQGHGNRVLFVLSHASNTRDVLFMCYFVYICHILL